MWYDYRELLDSIIEALRTISGKTDGIQGSLDRLEQSNAELTAAVAANTNAININSLLIGAGIAALIVVLLWIWWEGPRK